MMAKWYIVFIITLIFKYVFSLQNTSHTQDINLQLGEPDPDFEGTIINVTYPAGREAVLTCSVLNLGRYKVGWLRASDQTVLALQGRVVTHNSRITVGHEDMRTWHLRIRQLRESDRGCYMCQINTSPMKKQVGCVDVQVPPDIINEDSSNDIAVQEGEDATLTCRATGNPTPRITWRREDSEVILIRSKTGTREIIKVDTYNGTSMRLVRLERKQMGAYLCIASNDVPPAVSKRVSLSVHFSPSVRAPSQLLGTPLGSDVQLECHVEASPAPVSYWLKGARLPASNGPVIDSGQPRHEMLLDGPKYSITEERTGFRGIMRLVVRSFSPTDIGTYQCVSTNSLGRAEGTLRLYEIKLAPGSTSDDGHLNIIGGLAEAARGRANSSATSEKTTRNLTTITILLFTVSLELYRYLFTLR